MRTIEYNNYQGLETIRIMPESYCLATKENGKWERFRDAACDNVWEAIDSLAGAHGKPNKEQIEVAEKKLLKKLQAKYEEGER